MLRDSQDTTLLIIAIIVVLCPRLIVAAGDVVPCLELGLAAGQLSGLALPGDNNYNVLNFNKRFDSNRPLAIANVDSEASVASVLACARAAGVPAVARSGRHSYEGYSTLTGSVVIDLRPGMTNVSVLPGDELIVAQGGATAGQVYLAAWEGAGKGFAGGTHPTVGVSGLTLGGGFGFLSRRDGMTCDRVVSLRMVAWDGTVLVANATENLDLLWASCGGGGGNFGVFTEWTFRLSAVPDKVEYAQLEVPDELTEPMWSFYQTWAPSADRNLGMSFKPQRNPGTIDIYYFRPGPDAPSLAELIDSSGLLGVGGGSGASVRAPQVKQLAWDKVLLQYSDWGLALPADLATADLEEHRVARREKSFYLYQPLTASAINQISDLLSKPYHGSVQLHAYGGAVVDRADNATAFPHRAGVLGLVQAIAQWDTPGEAAQAGKWLLQLQAVITADQPHRGYVNYLDELLPGDAWHEVYYAGNYAQLLEVKRKYDGGNFFDFPQGIGHGELKALLGAPAAAPTLQAPEQVLGSSIELAAAPAAAPRAQPPVAWAPPLSPNGPAATANSAGDRRSLPAVLLMVVPLLAMSGMV